MLLYNMLLQLVGVPATNYEKQALPQKSKVSFVQLLKWYDSAPPGYSRTRRELEEQDSDHSWRVVGRNAGKRFSELYKLLNVIESEAAAAFRRGLQLHWTALG